jgi:hypothetical protein
MPTSTNKGAKPNLKGPLTSARGPENFGNRRTSYTTHYLRIPRLKYRHSGLGVLCKVFATIPAENGTEMTKILEVGEFYCFSRDVTPEKCGFLLLVVAAAGLCPGPSIFFDILFLIFLILSLNNYSTII